MKLAAIIPIYQRYLSEIEKLTIANNLKILSEKFEIIFIGPVSNTVTLQGLVIQYPQSKTIFFQDKHFSSISAYDSLLRSKFFYKTFSNYSYIFIVQTDALLFSDEIDEIVNKKISYAGAPWYSESLDAFIAVGNGGLSLRNVEHFLRCFDGLFYLTAPNWFLKQCNLWNYLKYKFLIGFNQFIFLKKIHEDFYWSQLIAPKFNHFIVADIELSKNFFLEVNYEKSIKIYKKLPIGIHAWEKYGDSRTRNVLLKYLETEDLSNKKKALSELF